MQTSEYPDFEQDFFNILDVRPNLMKFTMSFCEQKVCWRCIFMILRLSNASVDYALYRSRDYSNLNRRLGVEPSTSLCSVCQGVLEFCDS